MPRDRDDESGRFVSPVKHGDVLEVIGAIEGPAVVTADIAEALNCTRETARRKLDALIREGEVAKRETAGRVVLYWRK